MRLHSARSEACISSPRYTWSTNIYPEQVPRRNEQLAVRPSSSWQRRSAAVSRLCAASGDAQLAVRPSCGLPRLCARFRRCRDGCTSARVSQTATAQQDSQRQKASAAGRGRRPELKGTMRTNIYLLRASVPTSMFTCSLSSTSVTWGAFLTPPCSRSPRIMTRSVRSKRSTWVGEGGLQAPLLSGWHTHSPSSLPSSHTLSPLPFCEQPHHASKHFK